MQVHHLWMGAPILEMEATNLGKRGIIVSKTCSADLDFRRMPGGRQGATGQDCFRRHHLGNKSECVGIIQCRCIELRRACRRKTERHWTFVTLIGTVIGSGGTPRLVHGTVTGCHHVHGHWFRNHAALRHNGLEYDAKCRHHHKCRDKAFSVYSFHCLSQNAHLPYLPRTTLACVQAPDQSCMREPLYQKRFPPYL